MKLHWEEVSTPDFPWSRRWHLRSDTGEILGKLYEGVVLLQWLRFGSGSCILKWEEREAILADPDTFWMEQQL